MKDGKIGFGIVGIGVISVTHAAAIAALDDAYLVACFNKNMEKAQKWADAHGCKAYDSLDAMLADPEIDVVCICTPSGSHLEPAMACIHAGKHVLIEKPMEITEERVQALTDEAKKYGVVICGIFQSRYMDCAQLLKAAIEEGRFGKLTLADAQFKWFRKQEYYDSGAWRGTWDIDGGGVFMQQGIHAIDLLIYLMGDAEEVSAYTATLAHERIEVEDVAVATVRFKNGALGIIEGTTGAYPGSLKRIEICGSKGQVVLEEDSITKWEFMEERPEDAEIRAKFASATNVGGANDPAAIACTGHIREMADFINAIRTGTKPGVPGEEAIRAVHVIRSIYKSAETGTSVKL